MKRLAAAGLLAVIAVTGIAGAAQAKDITWGRSAPQDPR
jgi:hypothetical protein